MKPTRPTLLVLSSLLVLLVLPLSVAASHPPRQLLPTKTDTTTTTSPTPTPSTTTTTSPNTSPTTTTTTSPSTTPSTSPSTSPNTSPTTTTTTTPPPSSPTPPPGGGVNTSDTAGSGSVVTVTDTNSSSTSPSSAPSKPADSGGGSSFGTGSIIGVSVAGGVALIAIIAFFIWKFTRKRFTDFDDNEAIKWPELNAHGGSDSHALPVTNTGRAGFETGSEVSLSRVPSTSNYSTPDVGTAGRDPYAVPPLPHMNPNQPYRDDPTAATGYYDPYRGPIPGTLEHGVDDYGEAIPMTQMGPQAAYAGGRNSPAHFGAGRSSPGPQMAYTSGRVSPGPQNAYQVGRASPGPQAAYDLYGHRQ